MLPPWRAKREVDAWIAAATNAERLAFAQGRLAFELSDGRRVSFDPEPGVMLVDGVRLYSAA